MTGAKAPIDVAVGVVIRRDGAVLLGQRVPGKPYAGWWEFPGGKLEAGESVEHALARELHEELGLEVNCSLPWVVRGHAYPHATVRLHFRRVVDFTGEPSSREGQAFVWRSPWAIDVAPLLPATVPVIGWLRTSTLCIESKGASLGEPANCSAIERALGSFADEVAGRSARGAGRERSGETATTTDPLAALVDASIGTPIVLLDEPSLEPRRFESLFYRLREICAPRGASLLIGDSHPGSFAQAADGVVVSASRLSGCGARPLGRIAVARCRSEADLLLAARLGFDLAILQPGASVELAHCAGLPVYRDVGSGTEAIGARIAKAWREGAHGVASSAAFWHDGATVEPEGPNEG